MKETDQNVGLHKRPLFSRMEAGGEIISGQSLPQKTILGLSTHGERVTDPKALREEHGPSTHSLVYFQNRTY